MRNLLGSCLKLKKKIMFASSHASIFEFMNFKIWVDLIENLGSFDLLFEIELDYILNDIITTAMIWFSITTHSQPSLPSTCQWNLRYLNIRLSFIWNPINIIIINNIYQRRVVVQTIQGVEPNRNFRVDHFTVPGRVSQTTRWAGGNWVRKCPPPIPLFPTQLEWKSWDP